MVFLEGKDAVEKRYYSSESLEREVREFEERYGLRSEEFVAGRQAGTLPPGLSGFDAFTWAAVYEESCRLRTAARPTPA
jgi:hypothetical protein